MNRHAIKPENIFLIIATITGVLFSILTPVGGGFDEDAHMARVWEMSSGTLIPNQMFEKGAFFPAAFLDLSYRKQTTVDPQDLNYFKKNIGIRLDGLQMTNYQTRSVYNPILYLPGAVAIAFSRAVNLPLLIAYLLCRLFFVGVYVLTVYFAIKIIPYGKWVLTILALAPAALLQISAVSADTISNAGSFLFIAWVLAAAHKETPFKKREYLVLFLLTTLLFSLKIGCLVLVFLLFLIPRSRFGSRKQGWLVFAGLVILFIFVVGGWNILALKQSASIFSDPNLKPSEQIFSIVMQPFSFLLTIINFIVSQWLITFRQWVGVFGYEYGKMLEVIYLLYPILLIWAIFLDMPSQPIQKKTRHVFIWIAAGGFFSSLAFMYIIASPVGSDMIYGYQGRYLIPYTPLLFLAFLQNQPPAFLQKPAWLVKGFLPILITGMSLTLALVTFGLYFSFHVICGTQLYTPGLCYQPQYKNWAPNENYSPKVIAGTTLSQTFTADCAKMTQLRVWTDTPRLDSGWTTFILKDVQDGHIVFNKKVANQAAPVKNWLTLTLDEGLASKDRQYQLDILSDYATPDDAIRLGLSLRHEFMEGQLQINGQVQPDDLIFQYGCTVGKKRLLLPQ